MKKVSSNTISKFAEAIELCPNPELAAALMLAMNQYLEGNTEEAEDILGDIVDVVKLEKDEKPRRPIGNGDVDTGFREFD